MDPIMPGKQQGFTDTREAADISCLLGDFSKTLRNKNSLMHDQPGLRGVVADDVEIAFAPLSPRNYMEIRRRNQEQSLAYLLIFSEI